MRSIKNSNYLLGSISFIFVVIVFLYVLSVNAVFADDSNDEEESYFSNPAQAAHAAQLADEAALDNEEVQQAWDDYQDAVDNLGEEPTEEELAAVQALEDAYTEKLSEVTGVIGDDIEAMREAGMGWGDIAHELGVHPSALGLGHKHGKKGFSDNEIAEATARNTKNGSAVGHGLGLNAGVDKPGKGLGLGSTKSAAKSKGGNVSGASGLGKGKGNSASGSGKSGGNKGGNSSNAGGNKGGNSDNSGGGKGNNSGGKGGGKGNNGGGKGGGKGNGKN